MKPLTLTRTPLYILNAFYAQQGKMVPKRTQSEWLTLNGCPTSCTLTPHPYDRDEARLTVGYDDAGKEYRRLLPGHNDIMGVVAALTEAGLCPSTSIEDTQWRLDLLGDLRTGRWYLNVPTEQVRAALPQGDPVVIGSMPTKKRGLKLTTNGLTFINP